MAAISTWRQRTAVLLRAAKLISGVSSICRDALHTAVFMGRWVSHGVMLADHYTFSSDGHCRMAHARRYARQTAAATAAALYVRNDACSPEFDVELAAAYAPDYMGAAAWNGLHTWDGWYSFARTCHDTALSNCVHPEAALTQTDPVVLGRSKRATCKDIRSGSSASALVRRGLRQPTHGLYGRPRETAQDRRPRWVADLRNPTARDHLWHPAARSVYTNAPSAVVHLIMSLRPSHLVGDHLFDFGTTADASACSLCQERVFPSGPGFGSAPRAHADREHRWRHIEHLLFECPGIVGSGGTLAVKLLRDDLFRACFGSDYAPAVPLAAFPSDHTPVLAATACLVPFLLDPAAALGRRPPLAHEIALPGSCRGVLAWCVVCGVHAAASIWVSVGKPSPSCLVARPLVVALPAGWFFVCPGAAPCA